MQKPTKRVYMLALGALLLLAGCGGQETSSDSGGAEAQAKGQTLASSPVAPGGMPGSGGMGGTTTRSTITPAPAPLAAERASGDGAPKPTVTLAALTESQPDRYLIKNATLTIETGDVRKAAAQLTSSVREMKGYTSDSHETVDALGTHSLTMQIRIPFQQFDATMSQADTLGKILNRQVTAEDVTEDFVDTQAKLRNLKKTEERLLAHLSKTGKLSDTLLVETELTRVREEIEQLEGKVRFMAHRIAFSTVNVTFQEAAHPQAMTPPESYSVGKVTSEAMRSFIGFLQSALSLLIWLAVWSVIWVPLLLLARYLVRRATGAAR